MVSPVDLCRRLSHQSADNHKSAAGGPWGDGRENWCKEDGDEESQSRHAGGQSGLATFRNTGAGFDKGRDRRAAEEGSNGNGNGINRLGEKC